MSEPVKDFDLTHWKEVCYAHEAELEWLRAENARLRGALADMYAGWRYIRLHYGDLSGVGWERCDAAARAALEMKP